MSAQNLRHWATVTEQMDDEGRLQSVVDPLLGKKIAHVARRLHGRPDLAPQSGLRGLLP